jgi:hypothetical protein
MAESKTFRSTSGFGKRIEYWVIGRMLKEGMDVYVPLVDDHAVDAIVRRKDGSIALVQIKARSRDVIEGDAALFAAITHDPREHYWFHILFRADGLDLDHDLGRIHRRGSPEQDGQKRWKTRNMVQRH